MLVTITGNFPVDTSSSNKFNILDGVNSGGNFGCAWSTGETVIIPFPVEPALNQQWEIYSITITGGLVFYTTQQAFGKFGRIIAGLITNRDAQTTVSSLGPSIPQVPLLAPPLDQTLLATLWDPEVNPMPPIQDDGTVAITVQNSLLIGGTITPPNPLEIIAGEPLFLGIWMLPSLLGWQSGSASANMELEVFNLQYSISYDNGFA